MDAQDMHYKVKRAWQNLIYCMPELQVLKLRMIPKGYRIDNFLVNLNESALWRLVTDTFYASPKAAMACEIVLYGDRGSHLLSQKQFGHLVEALGKLSTTTLTLRNTRIESTPDNDSDSDSDSELADTEPDELQGVLAILVKVSTNIYQELSTWANTSFPVTSISLRHLDLNGLVMDVDLALQLLCELQANLGYVHLKLTERYKSLQYSYFPLARLQHMVVGCTHGPQNPTEISVRTRVVGQLLETLHMPELQTCDVSDPLVSLPLWPGVATFAQASLKLRRIYVAWAPEDDRNQRSTSLAELETLLDQLRALQIQLLIDIPDAQSLHEEVNASGTLFQSWIPWSTGFLASIRKLGLWVHDALPMTLKSLDDRFFESLEVLELVLADARPIQPFASILIRFRLPKLQHLQVIIGDTDGMPFLWIILSMLPYMESLRFLYVEVEAASDEVAPAVANAEPEVKRQLAALCDALCIDATLDFAA